MVTAALAADAEQHDREASFPYRGIEAAHRAGLLTATVGARSGGPGSGLADTVRILGALGAGDPAVALVTAMTLFTHAAEARTPYWAWPRCTPSCSPSPPSGPPWSTRCGWSPIWAPPYAADCPRPSRVAAGTTGS